MNYKLLKDYETPTMKIYAGCQKTIPEWCKVFPDMWGKDFEIKKDWFECVPTEKPPLGLMPEYIWIEKRIDEIEAAIKRYASADKFIPIEWVAECSFLRHQLENRSILFKSIDGVDILHGTKFYSVTDDFNIVFSDAVNGHDISDFIIKRSFSTIDAAKSWIAWNKPQLSVSEIMANSTWHCGANDMERRSFSRKEIIELSMSKVGRHDG
jgi:hypothetical protein